MNDETQTVPEYGKLLLESPGEVTPADLAIHNVVAMLKALEALIEVDSSYSENVEAIRGLLSATLTTAEELASRIVVYHPPGSPAGPTLVWEAPSEPSKVRSACNE